MVFAIEAINITRSQFRSAGNDRFCRIVHIGIIYTSPEGTSLTPKQAWLGARLGGLTMRQFPSLAEKSPHSQHDVA
jgi:hypothetical protein